jgi:hypothetical protein
MLILERSPKRRGKAGRAYQYSFVQLELSRLTANRISYQACQTDRVLANRAVCQTAIITGLGNLKISNR